MKDILFKLWLMWLKFIRPVWRLINYKEVREFKKDFGKAYLKKFEGKPIRQIIDYREIGRRISK